MAPRPQARRKWNGVDPAGHSHRARDSFDQVAQADAIQRDVVRLVCRVLWGVARERADRADILYPGEAGLPLIGLGGHEHRPAVGDALDVAAIRFVRSAAPKTAGGRMTVHGKSGWRASSTSRRMSSLHAAAPMNPAPRSTSARVTRQASRAANSTSTSTTSSSRVAISRAMATDRWRPPVQPKATTSCERPFFR
jgi:hypothetical protein